MGLLCGGRWFKVRRRKWSCRAPRRRTTPGGRHRGASRPEEVTTGIPGSHHTVTEPRRRQPGCKGRGIPRPHAAATHPRRTRHGHRYTCRAPCLRLPRQPLKTICARWLRGAKLRAEHSSLPFFVGAAEHFPICGMRIPTLLPAAAALLVLLLAVAGAAAQEAVDVGQEEVAALAAELGQLRAKASALEASIVVKAQELKSKDGGIETKEKVIGEMSQDIATLQNEIASLQSKGSIAAEEQASKASARAIELEKQIEKLKKDIDAKKSKKATMEARASNAEKKVQELNAKLERLQKTSAEQKRRVQKTQQALKVAEEELMRVQLEATTKSEQLGEVHGAWLPPWLATHAARSMELITSHWNEHGRPAFKSLLQKASEKSVQAKEWAKPHMETAKAKWIPVIKEKWAIAKANTEPYVQMVSAKSVEVYQASRDAISPHVLKAHQFADPYFQEAKKLSKPYIDQVAKASKPHVEKLKTTLKPYSKKAGLAYERFLEMTTLYHEQAQATILDYMHQHEYLKKIATGELVWYLASAWLLMPVYVLYILVTETFCTRKQKKSPRSDKAHHGHRRHKRRHADK